MTLKELEEKVKQLGPPYYYILNDSNKLDTNILEYNRRKKVWEYYFLDERGGKSQFKDFATEDEACEYAYNDAKQVTKIFTDAFKKSGKMK